MRMYIYMNLCIDTAQCLIHHKVPPKTIYVAYDDAVVCASHNRERVSCNNAMVYASLDGERVDVNIYIYICIVICTHNYVYAYAHAPCMRICTCFKRRFTFRLLFPLVTRALFSQGRFMILVRCVALLICAILL